MDFVILFIIFAAGFGFQAVLPGSLRMVLIYPLAFVLGLLTYGMNNFLFLAFSLGMTTRALVGGYWTCVALELTCLIAGLLTSFLFL